MSDSDLIRLRHMLDAAREAIAFTQDRARDDLRGDRMLLLAVIKDIEIIGEAASRISPDGKAEVPDIPWARIVAMRNRLTHGYFDWDLNAVWSTVNTNLPDLVTNVERFLRQAD